MQLLEVLIQRTHVDLAELFNYFAFVSSFLVHFRLSLTPSQSDLILWQTSRKCAWSPSAKLLTVGWGPFRLGGGTDMIHDGDSEGLW
jgi:hypothetical protein